MILANRVNSARSLLTASRYFSSSERPLRIPLLALILSLATVGHDLGSSGVGYCSAAFAMRYTGIWPRKIWIRWCCLGARVCHLQFHIRSFSTTISPSAQDQSERLSLFGKMRQLFSARKDKHLESRVAIAMNTTLDLNPAYYSMVKLTDRGPNPLEHVGEIHGIKHSLNRRFIGITMFQIAIMNMLDEESRQWAAFVQSIRTDLHEEVCNICLSVPKYTPADLSAYSCFGLSTPLINASL